MVERPTLKLLILTLCGLTLAVWLIYYGLQLRLFGQFLDAQSILSFVTPPHNVHLWLQRFPASGSAADWGWPLVVIGCSLLGSLGAFWKRQSWAGATLLIFGLASLITLHWMNSLSIVMLGLTRLPALREWLSMEE
jgi:hypothetical protein